MGDDSKAGRHDAGGWTLRPAAEGADCGWTIRGEDGRIVCHVQYEDDARLIMQAVREHRNQNHQTEN
jgi:hypothetical protein